MKKILAWLSENSSAMQGIAAVIVIVGAIISTTAYVFSVFEPSIKMRVNIDDSTVPSSLSNWAEYTAKAIARDEEMEIDLGNRNYFYQLALETPLRSKMSEGLRDFDRATLEIINQSSKVASGLRLRIGNVMWLWNVGVDGTYLNISEVDGLREEILIASEIGEDIVVDLPTIPPESVLKIIMIGDLGLANYMMNSVSGDVLVTNVIEVEEGWFIRVYNNPFNFFYFLFMFSLIAILIYIYWLNNYVKRKLQEQKKYTLYDTACQAATEGYPNESIFLLKMAVADGYVNRSHALKDPDLDSIKENKEFRKLFGSN